MTTLINSRESTRSNNNMMGGLCHLAEAATALSQLGNAKFSVAAAPVAASVVSTDSAVSDDGHQSVEASQQGESESAANGQPIISDDDEDASKKSRSSSPNSNSSSKKETFPQRLMAILDDSTLTDIITWLPNGESFVIVRPDVFTEEVLPKYLPPLDARSSTKYPSFTRKLNRWGFRQIQRGPDTGAFHHPFFRRDEQQLCLKMVCQRSRDRRSAKSTSTAAAAVPQASRSLPPKKRLKGGSNRGESAAATPPPPTVAAPASVVTRELGIQSSSGATVISGASDQSSSSRGTRVAQGVSLLRVSGHRTAESIVSVLSKHNGKLLEDALKLQEHNERIRIAKAMLFEYYKQALDGASQTSS